MQMITHCVWLVWVGVSMIFKLDQINQLWPPVMFDLLSFYRAGLETVRIRETVYDYHTGYFHIAKLKHSPS